jgi:hypothetical protein
LLAKAAHGALLLAGATFALPAAAADWPQFGRDAAHSGNNTAETTISASNVSQLIALYPAPVTLPAKVDGAPVFASGISTPNGVRDLLFLFGSDSFSDFSSTTGTLMAIDAASGGVVWSKSISGSASSSSQHASSSPAIDAAKQYVYSFGIDGYVHKYQIGNGTEVQTSGPTGWPQQVTLKPDIEKVASSLTIFTSGGVEYLHVVLNGYIGDNGEYQGHSVAINLAAGTRKVFNVMCSTLSTLIANGGCASHFGGIWGRAGSTYDAATNRVYVATGNGTFNPQGSDPSWSDSVLALAADGGGSGNGAPLDSYTPGNYQDLQDQDNDLGSTSTAILPAPAGSAVQHVGLQVGKDAQLHLIDLDNMSGGGGPGHVGGEIQTLAVPQGGEGMREQPSVWVNPSDGSTWLFVGNLFGHGISGLQLGLDGNNRPHLTTRWTKNDASTSSIVANGVLYNAGTCTNGVCVVARNPLTGDVLWSSPSIAYPHWQSPILVNGAIYIVDGDGLLWKFGLDHPASDLIFANGFDG